MKKKIAVIIRRAAFVCLLVLILTFTAEVFERKTLYGEWNYTLKVGGFSNLPEHSVNVVGVGSSHMYCTLNPVHIYEQTGDSYYVLATQQQPVEATYYYVKEALEQQSPDVIIIEGLMYLNYSGAVQEGVAHDAIDPFPDDLNKWKMIGEMNTEDAKENYYFPFLKYHTRWKELTKADFDFSYKCKTDPLHGFVFLKESKPNTCTQLSYEDAELGILAERNLEYLQKTVELVREHGSQPMILLAPYSTAIEDLAQIKALSVFCCEERIPFLDLNIVYNELGIDNDIDYYDEGHLNVYGAEKASRYIANFVDTHFELSDKNSKYDEHWQEDIAYYHDKKAKSAE
ncbi:MAG: hypothetical protein E7468_03415 [Ruminococcaceae bacterium]|nr:hypothetical protein [Oscillospiraceae bacterium]